MNLSWQLLPQLQYFTTEYLTKISPGFWPYCNQPTGSSGMQESRLRLLCWVVTKFNYIFKSLKNHPLVPISALRLYIGVLILLLLLLFHWKFETPNFGHFYCFQILDIVITTECITSRGYVARCHMGYDLIVISLVDWEVGNEKFKIKSTLGCGQVQFKTIIPLLFH